MKKKPRRSILKKILKDEIKNKIKRDLKNTQVNPCYLSKLITMIIKPRLTA